MPPIFGLVLDAAILATIVTVMEGQFPGWGPMLGCVLVIGVVSNAAAFFLPGLLSLLGVVVGAVVGAYLMAWLFEMTRRRAAIAAGAYLGVRIVLSLALMAVL